MRKKLFALLAAVVALSMWSLAPASACGERPLRGELDLQFNLGIENGPHPGISWLGTIEFGDEVYGLAAFPVASWTVQHLGFFAETWSIYPYDEAEPFFEFSDEGFLVRFEPGDVLMSGFDVGFTDLNRNRYRSWGVVDEASGPFADLVGHRANGKGKIKMYDFGAPESAIGILKIR